jgi:hypothetical protein
MVFNDFWHDPPEHRIRVRVAAALLLVFAPLSLAAQVPKGYKGKPFRDKYHKNGAQAARASLTTTPPPPTTAQP